jgi:hypothetical protein
LASRKAYFETEPIIKTLDLHAAGVRCDHDPVLEHLSEKQRARVSPIMVDEEPVKLSIHGGTWVFPPLALVKLTRTSTGHFLDLCSHLEEINIQMQMNPVPWRSYPQ